MENCMQPWRSAYDAAKMIVRIDLMIPTTVDLLFFSQYKEINPYSTYRAIALASYKMALNTNKYGQIFGQMTTPGGGLKKHENMHRNKPIDNKI